MKKGVSRDWSTKSQRHICRTPYLNVRRDRVIFPDQKVRPYLVVERHDFAVVVPRFLNGDLLMVRQYRYPLGLYTWEFPMGVVRGASLAKAAKIELAEETGYQAKRWTRLDKFYVAPGMTNQQAHVYLAEGLVVGEPHPEEGEFVIARRIPIAKIREWFRRGKIQDGPTLVAWSFLSR